MFTFTGRREHRMKGHINIQKIATISGLMLIILVQKKFYVLRCAWCELACAWEWDISCWRFYDFVRSADGNEVIWIINTHTQSVNNLWNIFRIHNHLDRLDNSDWIAINFDEFLLKWQSECHSIEHKIKCVMQNKNEKQTWLISMPNEWHNNKWCDAHFWG